MKTLAHPSDVAELLARLRTLRPDSRRRWGRMSAHQMVCHVNDAFRMATGEATASPATSVLQRTIVKWIALYLPVRWPPGIPTRPEIDQEIGGTTPGDFAADLAQVEARIVLIARSPGRVTGRTHPTFGRLSTPAWLRWAYLHLDHHLRQFGA